MKNSLLISGLAAIWLTALAASQAQADHERRVVVHETVYSPPALAYHSGPLSVYYGPSHTTRVITTSHRASPGYKSHRYGSRHHGSYGHRPSGRAPYGNVHRYRGKHGHGGHERHYFNHAPSRGSWSRERREVIYVDRDARKKSNYRRVERNSVVIRERRR